MRSARLALALDCPNHVRHLVKGRGRARQAHGCGEHQSRESDPSKGSLLSNAAIHDARPRASSIQWERRSCLMSSAASPPRGTGSPSERPRSPPQSPPPHLTPAHRLGHGARQEAAARRMPPLRRRIASRSSRSVSGSVTITFADLSSRSCRIAGQYPNSFWAGSRTPPCAYMRSVMAPNCARSWRKIRARRGRPRARPRASSPSASIYGASEPQAVSATGPPTVLGAPRAESPEGDEHERREHVQHELVVECDLAEDGRGAGARAGGDQAEDAEEGGDRAVRRAPSCSTSARRFAARTRVP